MELEKLSYLPSRLLITKKQQQSLTCLYKYFRIREKFQLATTGLKTIVTSCILMKMGSQSGLGKFVNISS